MPRIYRSTPKSIAQAREAGKAHKAKPFETYWIPEPNTGCWIWIGPTYKNGYGYYSETRGTKPRNVSAHVASFRRYRGAIPIGQEPHHICRFRPCVNPEHMQLLAKVAHRRLHANERRNAVTGRFTANIFHA